MLLTFILAAALWNCNCWWNAANIYTFAVQPGYLDFDNLPDTNFSCDGKVIGGYYADVETGCQMFHVCTIGQKAEITDIKFLCLNGTVFDQETRVCERLDEVDCSKSESFFDLNLELYGNNGAGYGIAPEEPPEQEPVQCNVDEEDCSGTSDYFDEGEEVTTVASVKSMAVTAATTTTTSTTTARTTTSTTAASTTVVARKPVAAITTPSTAKPPPPAPAISYPTNSPETIAALIALHNAFQESLKERGEQGPGPKGQRYPPPTVVLQQQQPSPKPFTVANFQPPRHFPSKAPQQPPPPYRHQQQHQLPVLLSSERFGNQNFRHGFRLQNGPPPVDDSPSPPPRSQSYQQQQYSGDDGGGGVQYDGSYEDGTAASAAAAGGGPDDEDVDDEESRRNFARETSEASVSVSVQVSSSSTKNSAINQQQQRQPPAATTASVAGENDDDDTAAHRPKPSTPRPATLQPPPPPTTDDTGDLYEDEYEELEGDEEFFKDVPKLGRNRRRRHLQASSRRRA